MGRPVTIDDSKLLETARDVFLAKGSAATTGEVARRAGISQASIFKRYKTKQELFLAAMRAERAKRDWAKVIRRRTQEAGLRQALVEVGVEVIAFASQVLPLALLGWSNRGEFGFPKEASGGMAQGLQDFAAFLEEEMAAGRLKRQDPWSVVRVFIGSLQNRVLMGLVHGKAIGPGWKPTEYVQGVVDVLWTGLAPEKKR